ncbi:hypothetical protein L210DRAFT_3503960 [Boletus edulis BED1]|uniref:Uncharacterized protein n=1 Tax=Boletus edulis BED1 TaxID=1328754 RepID=A0AAD4BU51_BOLED|nr:hypothetical protein L210DRAFT_3503960 [Boletus edulis BED1]
MSSWYLEHCPLNQPVQVHVLYQELNICLQQPLLYLVSTASVLPPYGLVSCQFIDSLCCNLLTCSSWPNGRPITSTSLLSQPATLCRNNAGHGGVTEQLAKLGKVLESPVKVTKWGQVVVPDSEPVNVLAPKEKHAKVLCTLKASKKKSTSRWLLPMSDKDGHAEPAIPKPVFYPTDLGDRFGFQRQASTALSYVGTQMVSEYEAMHQHPTPWEHSVASHAPSHHRSHSVIAPVCPPALPVHEAGCTHICQHSRSVVGQLQALAEAPPTSVQSGLHSLLPTALIKLVLWLQGKLRARLPFKLPFELSVNHLECSNPLIHVNVPALSQSLTLSRLTHSPASNYAIGPARSTERLIRKSTLEAHGLPSRSRNPLEKIIEVKSLVRQSHHDEPAQEFNYNVYYDGYDNMGNPIHIEGLRHEDSGEEEQEFANGRNTDNMVGESMYMVDASINMNRTQDMEGEGETFNLSAVQSGDSGNEGEDDELDEVEVEKEHMLTAAVIAQSTCHICKHFHGREDTPKDISMDDILADDINLDVGIHDSLDFDWLLPVDHWTDQEPQTQQVPPRLPQAPPHLPQAPFHLPQVLPCLPPPSSHQQHVQGEQGKNVVLPHSISLVELKWSILNMMSSITTMQRIVLHVHHLKHSSAALNSCRPETRVELLIQCKPWIQGIQTTLTMMLSQQLQS